MSEFPKHPIPQFEHTISNVCLFLLVQLNLIFQKLTKPLPSLYIIKVDCRWFRESIALEYILLSLQPGEEYPNLRCLSLAPFQM